LKRTGETVKRSPLIDAPSRPTPAAVVVNHDAGEELINCIRSLEQEGATPIVVVDNASSDGSVEQLTHGHPSTYVLRLSRNVGYGSGANKGLIAYEDLEASCGQEPSSDQEFVLVANPDVVVHPGALEVLVDALHKDAGLAFVGPRILETDGTRYPSARRFPSLIDAVGHSLLGTIAPKNRFTRRYQMKDLDAAGNDVIEVDWISGACLLGRRKAWAELGGFDEAYFMYAEDMDLCWRARQAGWAVAYAPEALVTHLRGVSTAKRPYRMLAEHHRSALRFATKVETGWRRPILLPVAALLAFRLMSELVRTAVASRSADSLHAGRPQRTESHQP